MPQVVQIKVVGYLVRCSRHTLKQRLLRSDIVGNNIHFDGHTFSSLLLAFHAKSGSPGRPDMDKAC